MNTNSDDHNLEILYSDSDCVVVNKPPGMHVHPTSLERRAKQTVQQLLEKQIGQRVFPAHRLDRPTSGVLVFGLSSNSVRFLTDQFAERQVRKEYLAIVRGFTDDAGQIDKPLKEEINRYRNPQGDPDKPAQSAVTHYTTIARTEQPFAISRYPTSRYSLLRIHPLTGRGHQIRRHLVHISHPIVGDVKYGDHRHNHFFSNELNLKQLFLVSHKLAITLPNGELMSFEAPPGDVFVRASRLLFEGAGDW